MKISRAAVLVVSCIPSTVAFVANTRTSVKTQLNVKAENGSNESWDHLVGPAMAGLAGLTLSSHMAVAATMDPSSVLSTSEIDTTPVVLREGTSQK